MLGKRSRAMQRSASKLHLLPQLDANPSSLASPAKHKPPVALAPRQVIGFDIAVSTPPPFPAAPGQARSPRSPRSGLESLLSRPPAAGIDLTAGRDVVHEACVTKKHPEAVTVSNAAGTQPPASVKLQSKPIHISRKEAGRVEGLHSHDDSFHCLHSCRSDSIKQEHPFPADFKEIGFAGRDSIFSTTSPASCCSDCCLLIDFLNSCFFCKRQLVQGKDIYMYGGDRAFCSVECRFLQITIDERKDKCSTSVPASMFNHRSRLHITSPAAVA